MKKLEYYGAKWCGPCQALKPIIEELKGDGLNIEVIDIDENSNRAIKNSVMSVPTIIIYKKGKELGRIIESPIESLEEDIFNILIGAGPDPNYYDWEPEEEN